MSGIVQRLLVVDDIEDNRRILARRLTTRGFQCAEAANGQDALELIAREDFALVLLDIMMPGIDGLEVLRRIRLAHSQSSLPVIMVTSKAEPSDIAVALSLGANDYVTKPVNFEIALARIQAQLARKQAEDALQRHVKDLEETNHLLQQEIAERKRSEARIQHMAYHDALTGLGNRVLLREHLGRALAGIARSGGKLALLCLDIDGFKSVNDNLGHPTGDVLLRAIAERLRACLRPEDEIARLGGDEFAVVQTGIGDASEVGALADRIIEDIARPYQVCGHRLLVGCSIGVALAPEGGTEPDLLLRRADLALYRAKAEGRGTCRFFELAMDELLQARRALEFDLRTALERDEFELHYQPIMNVQSLRISGFEALLRWKHPTRGLVPPGEFISLAEETGLILPIGDWALQEACAQAVTWPAHVRVAVNLSPAQFKGGKIVESVCRALTGSGLSADRLELEITETVLLDRNDGHVAALHELRALGVRIAMDDFGTGYSSLSYLRSFPFDKIKIDRSFVSDLTNSADCMAIIRAVTGLGNSLAVATLAEGVETEEQFAELRRQGCTELQGFLFGAARPAKDLRLILWMDSQRALLVA